MNTPKKPSRFQVAVRSAPIAAAAGLLLGGCGGSDAESGAPAHHSDQSGETHVAAAHSHDDPAETCFICDPSKRDEGRLWCREHARYEDRCWICHPELEDKSRLFCKEHSLYEDECHLCHPELNESAGSATTVSDGLFCNEHGVPEIECGICQPELAILLQPGGNLKVRLPSAQSATKAGIRTDAPTMSEGTPVVTAFCETQYNLNNLAKVTPLVAGVVRRVVKDLGDHVSIGDTLVELHSTEVAAAKSDYLSAIVNRDVRKQTLERERRLRDQSISAGKDLHAAEAAHRSASLAASNHRQKLVNLGLTENEIQRVEREQDTSAVLAVRAPFDGTLVERHAVAGEAVEVGHELFTLADLSNYWLELSIPADSIRPVKVGQTVEARFDELPGAAISGRITWIDSRVDPQTRMVRARALVTSENQRVMAGLFGRVDISIADAQPAAIVPRDALQRHEGLPFVFVRDESDLFSLRRVALGNTGADTVEIVAGLRPEDPVVTEGSFIVMSEFLKSRLGAGCVHE